MALLTQFSSTRHSVSDISFSNSNCRYHSTDFPSNGHSGYPKRRWHAISSADYPALPCMISTRLHYLYLTLVARNWPVSGSKITPTPIFSRTLSIGDIHLKLLAEKSFQERITGLRTLYQTSKRCTVYHRISALMSGVLYSTFHTRIIHPLWLLNTMPHEMST